MKNYIQLPLVALDSVLVESPECGIQHDLAALAPDVRVVASRMEETGYTLVLEGPVDQVYRIINMWEGDAR
jgi:hypothetical protein